MTSISQVPPMPSLQQPQMQGPDSERIYAMGHNPESQLDLSTGAIDATSVSEESLKELLKLNRALRFDWENKWLRGDQYAHMLNNIDMYRASFGMHKMAEKQHPENIYLEPISK